MKKLLLFLLLFSSATAQEHPSAPAAIRHVAVINVATGAELKNQTVKLQGNRIASVAPTQDGDATASESLDASGFFLIPGLWDMHVHVHNTNELPLYIANGVTGIRIMSGEKNEAAYRSQLAAASPSPEIYLASAIVDGDPPIWPGSIIIKKPADARRAIAEIKSSSADFIKVYNRIPRDAYFALADEAKQQHFPFAGHVPDAITAQEASDAGQRTFEHLQGIALACSSKQESLTNDMNRVQFFRDRFIVEANAYNSMDLSKCAALLAQLRRNETWQVPTLSVLRLWGRLDDNRFISDQRLVYIDRKSRDRWDERTEPQRRRWTAQQFQLARDVFKADEHILDAMFRAGVPLMAGTDAMNPYCFPGFSLHDELAMMVDSGLTPLAALQSATLNPAQFLGRTAELGSVEPGKLANLVLLRADPLADIHNTTQIQAVWLQGKYFDPDALARLLESVKLSAKH